MNSIDAVLQAFSQGEITQEEARVQIDALIHAAAQVGVAANIGSNTLGATQVEIARWQEEDDDRVRNHFITAMLHALPPNASSDVVAVFVWDVAQRIMDLRARKVGITKPGDPQLEPQTAPPQIDVKPTPFPASGTPPQMPTNDGEKPMWGDGSQYLASTAEVEAALKGEAPAEAPADPKTEDNQHPGEPVHDDGPF